MQHESFMLREKRLLSALSAALLPQPAFPGNVLHAKLISTRVLVGALLSCGASHSAVVLKWPKTLAAPCPLTSLIPTITSKTAPFQGTLTEQPSSLGLQLAQRGWQALALGLELSGGSSLALPATLLPRDSSSAQFWALLLEAMGLFRRRQPFPSSSPC